MSPLFGTEEGGISISKQKLPNSQLNGALNILSNNLLIERKRLVDYIYYKLASIRHLGEYNRVDVNKLIVLDLCRKYDILIPPSLLTTSKRDLLIFFKNHAPIITKSATTTIFGADKLVHLCAFTESLSETTIQNLPSFFAPSFFQANVLKRFEIRVFFIEEHFFAMAIFSQQNTRTQTDFRHYDDNKPNRMVPFKVPGQLKKKLMYLMDELELRTGSIDLIYSRDKEFYFLEVNPIGQFGMTSAPCNYNLEEKVAEYLSENSRHIKL